MINMAITSAKTITSATISWVLTSAKAIRSAYIYGNNISHIQLLEIMKFNIFPYTFVGVQNYWDNNFLQTKSKRCPVPENNHIYISDQTG